MKRGDKIGRNNRTNWYFNCSGSFGLFILKEWSYNVDEICHTDSVSELSIVIE